MTIDETKKTALHALWKLSGPRLAKFGDIIALDNAFRMATQLPVTVEAAAKVAMLYMSLLVELGKQVDARLAAEVDLKAAKDSKCGYCEGTGLRLHNDGAMHPCENCK